jgi:hypothetical protein
MDIDRHHGEYQHPEPFCEATGPHEALRVDPATYAGTVLVDTLRSAFAGVAVGRHESGATEIRITDDSAPSPGMVDAANTVVRDAWPSAAIRRDRTEALLRDVMAANPVSDDEHIRWTNIAIGVREALVHAGVAPSQCGPIVDRVVSLIRAECARIVGGAL